MGPSALSISFLLLCLLLEVGMLWGQQENRDVYVVYMGAVPADSTEDILKANHLQLLASVLQRGQHAEKTLIRSYRHGFSGFAARLSKEEALAISRKAGVVSVFVDPIYQLHTTRSWDFLQQTMLETDTNPDSDPPSSAQASDTIIGMKLIGARYYKDDVVTAIPIGRPTTDTPRDELGHGTHTASTAGGNAVMQASYYGLAAGTAKGGSTAARIAMYRVCSYSGCAGSAILAGFDDAIADGVDLLSVSLGASSYFRPDFDEDPIAIGAFHAAAKGITVVCSAGNDGPSAGTVVNAAPWILTVAATTIDRHFESDIMLGGNNKAVSGEAINFSNLEKSAVYPLIYGGSAKSNSSSSVSASHCEPDTLDANKIKGKMVLCEHSQEDSLKTSKPDVAAPGVNILASWIPSGSSEVPQGQKPSEFKLVSGTSMACPHVTGIAATIKAWNPTWSPAAIRSAIMTTATQTNNDKASLTTDSGSTATPYDYGAGEVSPTGALQPGLVYEAGTEDYLQFLCNYGYQSSEIKLITSIPDGFKCPESSSKDLISNLNYPSITISKLAEKRSKTVNRTVTNVGAEEETTYIATILSPPGIDVEVRPSKLEFAKNIKKLSYQVIFSSVNSSTEGDLFGSITWSDGTYKVRSPFVVGSN
ncbi:Subtilisin-like protease [Cocos nucifera]|uniref:Subtilisin-like protease n=1 Tax=Cocos nucifera TaxID=13894 RepID=A0A8K0N7D9_COCNU|nr:Subtilisin-like protease [Cocos nucifera]